MMMEMRRRALMGTANGSSRYKKLEYIINAGESFLYGDLGAMIPAEPVIIAADFKYLGDTNFGADLIGCNEFSIGRKYYPYEAEFRYGGPHKQWKAFSYEANTQYTVYADIELGHQDLYVNDELAISLTEDTLFPLSTIRFISSAGATSIWETGATFYCEFRRAYCRLKSTNALLFDFTPVLDSKTNLAGVEDAVTGMQIWERQMGVHSAARLGYKTLDGIIVAPVLG